jgi:hypothetical protein
MSESYQSILNRQWEDVQDEKTLPSGTFRLKCRSAMFKEAREEGQKDFFQFIHQVEAPTDDVDVSQLEELGENYDLHINRVFTKVFYETDADMRSVKAILKAHGVEPKGSIPETLKAMKGREALGFLGVDNYTDNAGQARTKNVVKAWALAE